MRSKRLISGAVVLALALASPVVFAQVFKWTDASGQVHYGDQGPANATQLKGPTPPVPPSDTPPAPRPATPTPAAPAADGAAAASPQQAQQVRRDVAAARAQQCKEARESYDKSVRAQRIFKTNDKGQREYMSAKDADGMRLQLKSNVDSACGS